MSYSPDNLTEFQKDQLLAVLFYRMTPEVRAMLMAEVPAAYNAAVDQTVVRVVRSNGTEVSPPQYPTMRWARAQAAERRIVVKCEECGMSASGEDTVGERVLCPDCLDDYLQDNAVEFADLPLPDIKEQA